MTETTPVDRSPRATRVVIAEDDIDSCHLLQMMLARLGHEVIGVAHDGGALFELTAQLRPDVIIADVSMPEMDGVSATSNVWKRAPVPIVLVSGLYSDQLRERAQLSHVMVYLQKPVTVDALDDAIRQSRECFAQYERVRAEARNPKSVEDDWRNVYQAKQMLVRSTGMNQADAFQRLQELAAKSNERIAQAARAVIAAHNLAESQLQSRAGQKGTP